MMLRLFTDCGADDDSDTDDCSYHLSSADDGGDDDSDTDGCSYHLSSNDATLTPTASIFQKMLSDQIVDQNQIGDTWHDSPLVPLVECKSEECPSLETPDMDQGIPAGI